MLDSSFLAGMTTSRVAAFQSKVGVGLVRSQPFHFPRRARTRLGDKNQYETEAIIAPLCGARITHRPVKVPYECGSRRRLLRMARPHKVLNTDIGGTLWTQSNLLEGVS